jgi:hypothetical protein
MINRRIYVTTITATILAVSFSFAAADQEAGDPWQPIKALLGIREDTGSDFGGSSHVQPTYQLVCSGNFVQILTQLEFPPQDECVPGENHEDLGNFSFDTDRESLVFRLLLSEGYVNT